MCFSIHLLKSGASQISKGQGGVHPGEVYHRVNAEIGCTVHLNVFITYKATRITVNKRILLMAVQDVDIRGILAFLA